MLYMASFYFVFIFSTEPSELTAMFNNVFNIYVVYCLFLFKFFFSWFLYIYYINYNINIKSNQSFLETINDALVIFKKNISKSIGGFSLTYPFYEYIKHIKILFFFFKNKLNRFIEIFLFKITNDCRWVFLSKWYLKWSPLFKKTSYFGLYSSSRNKF